MKWERLLSGERYQDPSRSESSTGVRSTFEQDIDRVVFSEGFRRLQNKTQVHPLPEDAFVHNRLTHSLEVSSVGRSLGKIVGEELIKKYPDLSAMGISSSDLGAIVSSASLAHDIGNPPFGHAGEKAISEYFLHGNGEGFKKDLTEAQWNDLANFEGNAHGFRLLNHSHSGIEGGVRLTFATLAAFMKYPKSSFPNGDRSYASQKKYGYFQSEAAIFEKVADSLGLIPNEGLSSSWKRHPLAFLVEAADDICYSIIDFEDAYGMGILSFEEVENYFKPLCRDRLNPDRYDQIGIEKEKVKYLRALSISSLVSDLSKVFLENEAAILDGSFDRSLMSASALNKEVKAIIAVSVERIYRSPKVQAMESAGFEILNGLLDTYIGAVCDVYERKDKYSSKLVVDQLPAECFDLNGELEDDLYLRLLKVTSYVAAMTDSEAIRKYRQLKGIELPK